MIYNFTKFFKRDQLKHRLVTFIELKIEKGKNLAFQRLFFANFQQTIAFQSLGQNTSSTMCNG